MDYSNLLEILENRFKENSDLHEGVNWQDVLARLDDEKLAVINNMEEFGGEPDLIVFNDTFMYVDTVVESVEERTNITYDQAAQDSRAKQKLPIKGNAVTICENIGTTLLSEEEYLYLQSLKDFDLKTSVWLKTDENVRKKGGAIFGDKRYGKAFIYHNGAQSFYKVRGFRSKLDI